eukprot:12160076-Alexandrium_andersonii.AAC.1
MSRALRSRRRRAEQRAPRAQGAAVPLERGFGDLIVLYVPSELGSAHDSGARRSHLGALPGPGEFRHALPRRWVPVRRCTCPTPPSAPSTTSGTSPDPPVRSF